MGNGIKAVLFGICLIYPLWSTRSSIGSVGEQLRDSREIAPEQLSLIPHQNSSKALMVGNITTTEISNKEQRFTKERSAVHALDNSTQQSSQLLTFTAASKPYFYIYVGPGKTGTTTVQDTFSKLDKEGILEKDNYVYLGRFSRHNEKWSTLAFCMLDPKYRARYNNTMSKDDCWQKSALPAAQEILSRNHLPN